MLELPKLIKIDKLYKFADLVKEKYFYILKKYNEREYLIQVGEDKNTQYDFIIPKGYEDQVIFKISGNIDSKKKYRLFLIDKVLIIYDKEYYEKKFDEILLKNLAELQEENKKIENLFNQLKEILLKGEENILNEKEYDYIEIEKAEDRGIDQNQFNELNEIYKEADIQKRLKRIKLYEKEKMIKEKEKKYGIESEGDESG